MKIIVGNGQFFADGFAVRNYFFMEEKESRVISYLSDGGCGAATLSLKDGTLSVTQGRIGVIRYAEGAELFALPSPLDRAEKSFSLDGAPCFCLICGDKGEVSVSGAVTYLHQTLFPLRAPRITLIEGQRTPILDLRATCNEGEYLALLSLSKEGVTLLLEEAGEIVTEQNEVRVTRKYRDLAGRTALTRYLWQGNGFQVSREIVCANEQSFMREQSGRALLEAVLAKDEKAVCDLLSPEIRDAEQTISYFGKIVAVRPAWFSTSPTACAAVNRTEKGYVGITYDFEYDARDKIENIVEI